MMNDWCFSNLQEAAVFPESRVVIPLSMPWQRGGVEVGVGFAEKKIAEKDDREPGCPDEGLWNYWNISGFGVALIGSPRGSKGDILSCA